MRKTFTHPQNNMEIRYYDLTLEQCTLVGMRESKGVRRAVLAKIKELESQQPRLPTNYVEALESLLTSEKEKLVLIDQLNHAKPMIEFCEQVCNSENLISVGDFAKLIGTGRNKLFDELRERKILMRNNVPYQRYIDQGWLEVKEVVKNNFTYPVTLITGRGQVKIAELLCIEHDLPE